MRLTAAQRRLVARLALDLVDLVSGTGPARGRRIGPTGLDQLAAAVWPDGPPTSSRASLHNQVSRLRKLAGESTLRSDPDGYWLDGAVRVDAVEVLEAAGEVEELLAADQPGRAFDRATAALSAWRGTPFADVLHLPEVRPAGERLAAERDALETLRLEAAIASGRVTWAITEGEQLTVRSPHDEHRAVLLARALHLRGRRGDALAALSTVRRALRRDLGVDPGPELDRTEQQLLTAGEVPAAAVPDRLVGRADEVRSVVDSLAGGGLVHLVGEPGSGVSTLLRLLRRELASRHFRTVAVSCPEYAEAALSVLEDILHELDAHPSGGGVIEAFRAALAEQPGAPLVLLVDDARHAGPSTVRELEHAATVPGVSVLLAGLREPPPRATTVHELGPLAPGALRTLVLPAARRLDRDPDRLAALVGRLSGGNPLLAGLVLDDPELLEGTVRSSTPVAPTHAAGPIVDPVSPALAALVEHWRADLSRADNALLDWLAVAGGPVPFDLLHDVLGTPLPDCRFVRIDEHDDVTFRHEALRHVVYEGLPPGRRTEMHQRVGETARERGYSASVVATHLWRAREAVPLAARDAALAAATEATAAGAHRDAALWLAAGIDLTEDPADRLRLRVLHGDALRLCGDPSHVDELLEAAAEAARTGDEELLGRAAYALLQLGRSSDLGSDERVRDFILDVLGRLGTAAYAAPVRAAASLAWSMTGRAAQARALFDRAERSPVDAETRRQVLPFAYLGLGLPEDLPRRRRLTAELDRLAGEADDPVAAFEAAHLGVSDALLSGDGPAVREHLRRMEDLLPRVGDIGRRWQTLYTRAAVAHLDDDLESAVALTHQAFAIFESVSPARASAAYYGQLLALWAARGELAPFAPALGDMVRAQPGVPAWHAAHALALTEAGRAGSPETSAELEAALAHAQPDFTWLATHVIGGRAAAADGDPELCVRFRDALAPWSGLSCWQGTCSYGPVDTTLALLARALGDTGGARRHTATAAATATRLEAPVFMAELARLGLT